MSRKVFIFDTTLRDGEQSPGISFNEFEKMEIAKQLVRLNVDVIEAGNPISSPRDFEAVQAIAKEVRGTVICALARCKDKDIKAAAKAVRCAEKPRVHVYVNASDIQMQGQLRKSPQQVLDMAVHSVELAKSMCQDVQFSPMDAGRAAAIEGPQFLYKIIQAAIEAGATVINVPDTVGYAVPEQFGQLICDIQENVPGIEKVVLSIHCHDDLGMSTANSLAGIKAGAIQVECAINDIGERAGNASLPEVVAAIKTRPDYFGAYTDINTTEVINASRLVKRITGFPVPPNKAVVGDNALVHSSGGHQDGVLKERTTFEILEPEEWGWDGEHNINLTTLSGRKGLRSRLEELGYTLSDDDLNRVYERFITVAGKKREIFDEDLIAIADDELPSIPQTFSLGYFKYSGGPDDAPPRAEVGLYKEGVVEMIRESADGDGPVDAAYKAIDKVTGLELEIAAYSLGAATGGRDAIGEVIVRIKDNGRTIIGRGASTDIVEASTKAYVNAINRLLHSNE